MIIVLVVAGFFVFVINAHSEYVPDLLRRIEERRHVKRTLDTRFSNPLKEDKFFGKIIQLTQEGTNAEAYWSFDDKMITFQGIRSPYNVTHNCDLIWNMMADGSQKKMVAPVAGRDTCSYFYPNDPDRLLFSSTMGGGKYCPAPPDRNFGYVWPLNKDMDIYTLSKLTNEVMPLTGQRQPGYNAETTISPDGKRAVFTSDRDGDLELYTMDLNGGNVERMTYSPGYDGGAYFSYSNKMLAWRAARPAPGPKLRTYLDLLSLGLIEPLGLQLYYMELEGATAKMPVQVTNETGVAGPLAVNFSPFFLPDDSGLIFSSNMMDPHGATFHLFVVDLDGSNLEQVTFSGTFNSFPMFSFNKVDGYYQLLWCSDRGVPPSRYGEINVFKADWLGRGHGIAEAIQVN